MSWLRVKSTSWLRLSGVDVERLDGNRPGRQSFYDPALMEDENVSLSAPLKQIADNAPFVRFRARNYDDGALNMGRL